MRVVTMKLAMRTCIDQNDQERDRARLSGESEGAREGVEGEEKAVGWVGVEGLCTFPLLPELRLPLVFILFVDAKVRPLRVATFLK